MHGKTRRETAYYACELDPRHHKGRRDWSDDHPKSIWIREDDLLVLVCQFFAEHVFGPRRQATLKTTLNPVMAEDPAAERLKTKLTDLNRRQDNLLIQIEEYQPTGDADIDRDFRVRLQRRYAEVARQRKTKAAELDARTNGRRSDSEAEGEPATTKRSLVLCAPCGEQHKRAPEPPGTTAGDPRRRRQHRTLR